MFSNQSSNIIFCDATSSFDRHNSAIFLISTVTPAGALPLGVVVTSDEQEETIINAFKMLQTILPAEAFFGQGPKRGPSLVMIDDSAVERNALCDVWKSTTPLLCTFHFLQRRWTWLHDAKNGTHNKEHRSICLNVVKDMVYAENESTLEQKYKNYTGNEIVKKYPQYISHIQSLWPRRKEWAHCYRKRILVRGNHTNNYSEASMKILKELVFSRVKAYNMVQIFHFLSETFENYYCRKLLSISNNRLDTYVALRYQGLYSKKISKDGITEIENDAVYTVNSSTQRGVFYTVDMTVGVCTCPQGVDGSPCTHQAAVVLHYGTPSINCIPSLSPHVRRIYARIALGEKAEEKTSFYAGLHDSNLNTDDTTNMFYPDFTTTAWDLMRAGSHDNAAAPSPNPPDRKELAEKIHKMSADINEIAEDLKSKINEGNDQLLAGIEKFINRYGKLKSSPALLASSMFRFGWTFGGTTTSRMGGHLRHGRRINVQATAAGRRKGTKSRGKAKATPGKPVKSSSTKSCLADHHNSRYFLPTRRPLKGKRPHSLNLSITKGCQNAGKW